MKKCSKCKIEKLLVEFGKDKSTKDGYKYQCKVCKNQHRIDNPEYYIQYAKQWRKDNAEHCSQYSEKYYKDNIESIKQQVIQYRQTPHGKLVIKASAHKHRISLRDNTVGKHFTPADLIMKLKLQKGECIYCEISIKDSYHIDHIIPPCDGGGNEAWNIQLLCRKCNRAKWNNPAYEYAQKHGKLV